jgi:hypothetical protein
MTDDIGNDANDANDANVRRSIDPWLYLCLVLAMKTQ